MKICEAMVALTSYSAIFILLCAFASASPTANETHPHLFSKIYAFGDSFTDTGNTRSVSGPTVFGHVSNSPYGSTFFHHSTNRYSDGRLVIDFIAQTLSLPFLTPYRYLKGNESFHGVNFAVAGSTAINHDFFVRNNLSLNITPQSIQTQLHWFNKFLETQGHRGAAAFDDALFWVGEIGVNDYAYNTGSPIPDDTIRKLGVASVTGVLQSLLKKGAKYMVVQGLPPSGCLPLAMSIAPVVDRDDIGCVRSSNNQTYYHNLALRASLQSLRRQFPQAVIIYADYWNVYRTVMKNPGKYGFRELFKACCGIGGPYNFNVLAVCGMSSVSSCKKPYEYINWDGVHLTEAMYKVVHDMFVEGGFTEPPFGSLFDKKRREG
ncbi:GDSL esterase/lipase, partial [Cucurbita argyrosperma subsp. sororia]